MDIQSIFAEYFTMGNKNTAWDLLNAREFQYRKIDIARICFFGGGAMILNCILIFNIWLHHSMLYTTEESDQEAIDREDEFWSAI